jgi:hypothetical protein
MVRIFFRIVISIFVYGKPRILPSHWRWGDLFVASTKFMFMNLKLNTRVAARTKGKRASNQWTDTVSGGECGRYSSELVPDCEPVWLLWNFRTAGVQSGAERSLECQSSLASGSARRMQGEVG